MTGVNMVDSPPTCSAAASSDIFQPSKPQQRPGRSREKPQLSCNLCRRRKLRCDRAQPCGTCARRDLSISCTYTQSNNVTSQGRAQLPPAASANMLNRIGQLERLVTSLMDNLNNTKSTNDVGDDYDPPLPLPLPVGSQVPATILHQDSSQLSDSFGRISLENAEVSYVESAHWTAILDEIAELKDYFEDENKFGEQDPTAVEKPDITRRELLFGNYRRLEKQEILAALPARSVCDGLVARYFHSVDLAPSMIHRPTFLNEYEKFWISPMQTPVMWVGLLYGVMAIATSNQKFSSNGSFQNIDGRLVSEADLQILAYREKVIQSLCLGEYMKGVPYTIETLMFFFNIESYQGEDAQSEIWILLGLIVRLALKLGYHRDGSHSPRISPFQAEMRRRNWAMIFQLDVLIATQFGLPRMIREAQSDTAEPQNLLDEDFDENSIVLPEPRLAADLTPIYFVTVKNRLVSVLGMIADTVTCASPSSYAEIMSLDKKLLDTYHAMPSHLHMRPIAESTMDESGLIFGRFILILLFHKAQCILHRRYLLLARTDSRYTYSRSSCVEAALSILQLHSIVDEESRQGGRLYEHRWKSSSLTRQEFLLATTILCLEIHHESSGPPSSTQVQNFSLQPQTRERIITALCSSYLIWLRSSDSSREARKAAQAVRIVLGKVESTRTIPDGSNSINNDFSATGSPKFSLMFQANLSDMPPINTRTSSAQSFDVAVDPFDMEGWNSDYQIRSIDEFLDMSEWVGVSRFPF